jgi:hypothetical protein
MIRDDDERACDVREQTAEQHSTDAKQQCEEDAERFLALRRSHCRQFRQSRCERFLASPGVNGRQCGMECPRPGARLFGVAAPTLPQPEEELLFFRCGEDRVWWNVNHFGLLNMPEHGQTMALLRLAADKDTTSWVPT